MIYRGFNILGMLSTTGTFGSGRWRGVGLGGRAWSLPRQPNGVAIIRSNFMIYRGFNILGMLSTTGTFGSGRWRGVGLGGRVWSLPRRPNGVAITIRCWELVIGLCLGSLNLYRGWLHQISVPREDIFKVIDHGLH